jgi:hypothetical protein
MMSEVSLFLNDVAQHAFSFAADTRAEQAAKAALCDWLYEKGVYGQELMGILDSLAQGVLVPCHNPDPRFAETEFVVQASDCERQDLWERFAIAVGWGLPTLHERRIRWVQDVSGLMVFVGAVWSRPVNISCAWAWLNGHVVLFYDACSQLVDYSLIEQWLMRYCNPSYEHGRRAHTNAMNFHLCLDYCQQ